MLTKRFNMPRYKIDEHLRRCSNFFEEAQHIWRGRSASTFDLNTFEARAKLCSIRHYCFVRGVVGKNADRIGGDDDFRQAFRIVNRLYFEVQREIALHARRETQKPSTTQRRRAA